MKNEIVNCCPRCTSDDLEVLKLPLSYRLAYRCKDCDLCFIVFTWVEGETVGELPFADFVEGRIPVLEFA